MNFQQAISRYKSKWVIGQCLKTLLLLVAISVATVILYGIADSIWAMNNTTRLWLNRLLVSLAIIAALVVIYRAIKVNRAEVSTLADESLSNHSRSIRGAHDLSAKESISPMNDYLISQAQEEAVGQLGKIPLKEIISFKKVGLAAVAIFGVIGAGAIIKAAFPERYDVVSQRLKHPDRDIPPYSPLVFTVTQNALNTVYGGENRVQVEITGGDIEHEVMCLIKNNRTGKIDSVNAFQDSATTYSKSFTNVITDIEYSFTCGKARSEWKKIDVLLQPKFTNAMIKITPPSYTKREALEFALEGNQFNVIQGSKIELSITSNRPLSNGELIVTSEGQSEANDQLVEGVSNATEPNKVKFEWVANSSSQISCKINDIRGTGSAAPLEFTVVSRADLAPAAELISPARYVLATPNSVIPLQGVVKDDYEIDSVYLVRTLLGFRDRAKEVANNVGKVDYGFGDSLDLNKVGVKAEQVLEFYLEASDRNPSLLGVGTSDVVRVEIITEKDYAERLRNTSKIAQFNIRYRVMANAIREAVNSLRQLNEANKKNEKEAFTKQQKESQKVHNESRQTILKIAEDFQAFELESELSEIGFEVADKLLTNFDQLVRLEFTDGIEHNESSIEEMVERLGSLLEQAERLEQNADDLKLWGDVALQAAIFNKLTENQLSIAKRITTIAKEILLGDRRNAKLIVSLGEAQQKNKLQMLQFAKDLAAASKLLPERFLDLQGDCEVWLKKYEALNIPDPMDATTEATEVGKSRDASTNAFLAHALMRQLIEMEKNQFAQLIRGELPENQDKDIEETMKQMLEALCKQNAGPGEGGGRGLGGAGGGRGKLQRNQNLPMFGPNRLNFSENFGQSKGLGAGGSRTNGKGKAKVSENNAQKSSDKRDTKTLQALRTNVPNKYKDAVKKFYSDFENDK